MNIEYFESFIETVKQKSLSKASEQLNITQPALSKQIRKIEDYFETSLLNRSTSGVELTEAGKLVYKKISRVLEELSLIKNDLKEFRQVRNYKIGTLPSLASHYFPSKILNIKEQGVDTELVIKNSSPEVYELLTKGELDAAIIDEIPINGFYWKKEIFAEPYYAIVYKSHPFSKNEFIYLEDLIDEEFVLYPSTCTTRQTITRVLEKLNVKTEVEFGGFLIGYVAAGGGITVLPEIVAKNNGNPMVKAIPILNNVKRHISLITNSKSTGKFLYSFFKENNA
ncbi:MAG: LysR family transcriptional regulator [Bacillota bacterium]|nr:LysR family transcriptional regulator [Bacillota bacterium]